MCSVELWLWASSLPVMGISGSCSNVPRLPHVGNKSGKSQCWRGSGAWLGTVTLFGTSGLVTPVWGVLASLDSWNCSTTYWFCWRNSNQPSQAMLFISCCHHNYFLRAAETYSFLSLLAVAQRIKDKDYNGYVQAEELLIGIYPFKYV